MPISGLDDCQRFADCPFAVQAVSDDGRYVALGHGNTDPGHVTEAHLVLDMNSGSLAVLPKVTGTIDKVYFRDDGWVLRTISASLEYTFWLVDAAGNVTGSFPDAYERANGRLVAHQPWRARR